MLFRYFILFALLLCALPVTAQEYSESVLKKLSPQLQSVVAVAVPQLRTTPAALYPQEKPVGFTASGKPLYGVICNSKNPEVFDRYGITRNTTLAGFVTARVTDNELLLLAADDQIITISSGELLFPFNDMAAAVTGADLVKSGFVNNTSYKGNGVLICIIDTGIDWAHKDFRGASDTTISRIEYIWDQTITPTGGETNPSGFSYGVEYTKTHIENEIDGTPAGFVRENDINGHGTHVAGTAAGNGASLSSKKYEGIAPQAKIIVVKAGNGSFPTTNIIDALTYAKNKATLLGMPIVANLSLGGHSNAHDGTRNMEIAVDSFSGTGRVAVIAAGNDGENAIHIAGTLPASSSSSISFSVPAYSANSGTNTDYFGLDLYFDSSHSASVTVTTPNSFTATQTAGTYATTQTNDGTIFLYNDIADNGDREIYLYAYDANASFPPATGTWSMTITNNTAIAHPFHAWLFANSMGTALTGGNTDYTVASPGTANSAITVGSFVSRWRWYGNDGGSYSGAGTDYSDNISSFSSKGPRRDGAQKPDITAPGEKIISSTSTASAPSSNSVVPGAKHHRNQGTSMASPVVAGLSALMLSYNNSLAYSDIKSALRANTVTDSYTGSTPNYTWGYGKANIYKALTKVIAPSATANFKTFLYDSWSSTSGVNVGTNVKLAVRFSPDISGTITNILFHLYTAHAITSAVIGEIWSDASGLPSVKLGSSSSIANELLLGHTWNAIPMQSSGVTVTAGTDYHAVIYFTSGSTSAFALDIGSIDSRSSYNSGSSWSSYGSGDLRIRPIVSTDNGVLPIELNSFSAQWLAGGISLHWVTESEINNHGFTVQRKNTLGSLWHDISFIPAKGNSFSRTEYHYFDTKVPLAEQSPVYRLKQTDRDGSVTYSNELLVNIKPIQKNALGDNYPNPFSPDTYIPFSLMDNQHISLAVYSVNGERVASIVNNQPYNAGHHSVHFSAATFASGTYIIVLTTPTGILTNKMMLQR